MIHQERPDLDAVLGPAAVAPFGMVERVAHIVIAGLPVLVDRAAGEFDIHCMGGIGGTAMDQVDDRDIIFMANGAQDFGVFIILKFGWQFIQKALGGTPQIWLRGAVAGV